MFLLTDASIHEHIFVCDVNTKLNKQTSKHDLETHSARSVTKQSRNGRKCSLKMTETCCETQAENIL